MVRLHKMIYRKVSQTESKEAAYKFTTNKLPMIVISHKRFEEERKKLIV